MDALDELVGRLNRVEARLGWLPTGAVSTRALLEAQRAVLRASIAELLAAELAPPPLPGATTSG